MVAENHDTLSVNGQEFTVEKSERGHFISAPSPFAIHLLHLGYVGVNDQMDNLAAPVKNDDGPDGEGRDKPVDEMNYSEQRAYLKGLGVPVVGIANKDLLALAQNYKPEAQVEEAKGEEDEIEFDLETASYAQLRQFLNAKGVVYKVNSPKEELRALALTEAAKG